MRGQQVVDFNPAKLRSELINRGLTLKKFAAVVGVHENTILNAMRTGHCDATTLKKFALGLQTIQPVHGIEDLRLPEPISEGRLPFPLAVDPFVRATLATDSPVLVAERRWYELDPTHHREFTKRITRMRSGGLNRARDFDLSDVETFLAEMT